MFLLQHFCVCTAGDAMKLEKCVKAIVLGFNSIDDTMKLSQFNFKPEEKRVNLYSGERASLFQYILDHFCCPSGTVLDISCNPTGLKYIACIRTTSTITILSQAY